MYSFSTRQFIWEYLFFGKVLECKKINKAQMVDFHKKNHKRFAKDKVEKTTVSQ